MRIARQFNTYGPRSRLDDGRVVPAFYVQAITGQPLTVFGSGQQTRSLCYIDDLVRGLIALMETPGLAGEVINLGCPEERTVLEIAAAIQRAAGCACPIVHRPLPIDDPARRCPDITRANTLLGWEPEIGFEDGLACTLTYFHQELEALRIAAPPGQVSTRREGALAAVRSDNGSASRRPAAIEE